MARGHRPASLEAEMNRRSFLAAATGLTVAAATGTKVARAADKQTEDGLDPDLKKWFVKFENYAQDLFTNLCNNPDQLSRLMLPSGERCYTVGRCLLTTSEDSVLCPYVWPVICASDSEVETKRRHARTLHDLAWETMSGHVQHFQTPHVYSSAEGLLVKNMARALGTRNIGVVKRGSFYFGVNLNKRRRFVRICQSPYEFGQIPGMKFLAAEAVDFAILGSKNLVVRGFLTMD